jgi:hypothetical protein
LPLTRQTVVLGIAFVLVAAASFACDDGGSSPDPGDASRTANTIGTPAAEDARKKYLPITLALGDGDAHMQISVRSETAGEVIVEGNVEVFEPNELTYRVGVEDDAGERYFSDQQLTLVATAPGEPFQASVPVPGDPFLTRMVFEPANDPRSSTVSYHIGFRVREIGPSSLLTP